MMLQELSTNYSLVVNCHVGISMYALTRVDTHHHAVLATSLRSVHASGTKLMRGKNFEHFKIFSSTWHTVPHFSHILHALLTLVREVFTNWHAPMRANS